MSGGVPSLRRMAAPPRALCRVRRQADVDTPCPAAPRCRALPAFFQKVSGSEALRVEDIHVRQPHAPQALVEAGEDVLTRRPHSPYGQATCRSRPWSRSPARRDVRRSRLPGCGRSSLSAEPGGGP